MLWYCMLSNSRCNHGLNFALLSGKMFDEDCFFKIAVATEHSGAQHVAKEFLRPCPHQKHFENMWKM